MGPRDMKHARRWTLLLLATAGALCAESCRHRAEEQQSCQELARRVEEIQLLEWRRETATTRLNQLLLDECPTVRSRAALAVGRLGLGTTEPALHRLLADGTSEVRLAAAFALRLLVLDESEAQPRAARSRRYEVLLAQRLSLEREPRVAQALLETLGWIAAPSPRVLALLTARLRQGADQGALLAAVQLARRGRLDAAGSLAEALATALRASSPEARELAARSLAAARAPLAPAVRAALLARKGDPSALVRQAATRAIARQGSPEVLPWLAERLLDYDPAVEIAAARGLGRLGAAGAARLIAGLRQLWRSTSDNHFRLTGPELHAVLGALRALEPNARMPEVRAFAAEMLQLADASDAAVSYEVKEAQAVDLMHCAAARLWDLGAGRLEKTPACGTAHAERLTSVMRREQTMRLLPRLPLGLAAKLAQLKPQLSAPEAAVRAAAFRALARLGPLDEQPTDLLHHLIAQGLQDQSLPVTSAAAACLLASQLPLDPQLSQLLLGRLGQLATRQSPARTCKLLAALPRSEARALLQTLQTDSVRGVRLCAARLLGEPRGARVPAGRAPARHASASPQLRAELAAHPTVPLPRRAKLVTTRGVLELELLGAEAPLAVSRFAALVRSQHYRQLRITRISPLQRLELVSEQPAPPLPCELTARPFVAGSVGWLLPAGRDSADGSLVISLVRAPALDGRTTQFAHLSAGLDVAARLQPGDLLLEAYILD